MYNSVSALQQVLASLRSAVSSLQRTHSDLNDQFLALKVGNRSDEPPDYEAVRNADTIREEVEASVLRIQLILQASIKTDVDASVKGAIRSELDSSVKAAIRNEVDASLATFKGQIDDCVIKKAVRDELGATLKGCIRSELDTYLKIDFVNAAVNKQLDSLSNENVFALEDAETIGQLLPQQDETTAKPQEESVAAPAKTSRKKKK
jgi:hypothetical protein